MEVVFNALFHVPFVLLLCGFTLYFAVSFCSRPTERKLAILRPLAAAVVFALLSALCAGLGCAFFNAARAEAGPVGGPGVQHLYAGLCEAMVPAVVGFAVLALAWALAAVGFQRQTD